jgi:hypothetical protein
MDTRLEKLIDGLESQLRIEKHKIKESSGIQNDAHRWNIARLEARLEGIFEAIKYNS